MSFFLVLSQVGFLKHAYVSTLHEFFDCHEMNTKKKIIHVEYAGSGQYVKTVEVGPTTTFDDVIPNHHVAFHGHNGPQIHDLCNIQDQDTITIRKQVFRGELSHTLEGHTNTIYSVAWNSQGTLLASGSCDRTIKVLDVIKKMSFFLALSQVGFLKHGYLSTLHEFFEVHEIKSKIIHVEYAGSGIHVKTVEVGSTTMFDDVIPDHHLAFHGHNGPQIHNLPSLQDQDTVVIRKHVFCGELTHIIDIDVDKVHNVAWNPQRTMLASGSYNKTVKIWDTQTWKCIQILSGHTDCVNSVMWNSQGTLLASGSGDDTIKIWNTKTWTCIQTLEGHTDFVNSVAWNSQGTLLASGSGDDTIIIWESKSWKCVKTLEEHTDSVSSVAWDTQGTLLASGSEDQTIKIWDSKTWQCIQTLEEHTIWVYSVAWNPQGTLLASGSHDTTIKIWDSKTWKCVQTLEEHTLSVYSVAWNSQGTLLASGSDDQMIRVWDTKSWKCIKMLKGHTGSVGSVAWNSNEMLVSGSADKTIRVWK